MAHAQRHVVAELGSIPEQKKFPQPLRANHARDLPLLRKLVILNHAKVIPTINQIGLYNAFSYLVFLFLHRRFIRNIVVRNTKYVIKIFIQLIVSGAIGPSVIALKFVEEGLELRSEQKGYQQLMGAIAVTGGVQSKKSVTFKIAHVIKSLFESSRPKPIVTQHFS